MQPQGLLYIPSGAGQGKHKNDQKIISKEYLTRVKDFSGIFPLFREALIVTMRPYIWKRLWTCRIQEPEKGGTDGSRSVFFRYSAVLRARDSC